MFRIKNLSKITFPPNFFKNWDFFGLLCPFLEKTQTKPDLFHLSHLPVLKGISFYFFFFQQKGGGKGPRLNLNCFFFFFKLCFFFLYFHRRGVVDIYYFKPFYSNLISPGLLPIPFFQIKGFRGGPQAKMERKRGGGVPFFNGGGGTQISV